ncbi:GSCOCG00010801001-RA-CDS [Cotesia congregata]|uniref:Uncharacterized protein n=1 Tax=Cotesia congregata TaxID=51543 RepID=A0A8J2H5C6_COTCN|nr:GSCOCG00010801001-RA-CDS [Cotesia congregata]CAG5073448.1 Protein of unknown function [Cotesia congregata]
MSKVLLIQLFFITWRSYYVTLSCIKYCTVMASKSGRKPNVDRNKLIETINKHIDTLITKEKKVIHKGHEIWQQIANELDNKLLPESLYSIVTNNKYNVRKKLPNQSLNSTVSSVESENLSDSIEDANIKTDHNFTFTMSFDEYDSMICTSQRKRRKLNGYYTFPKKVFKPYYWENSITNKIWKATHKKCGYNFIDHYVAESKMSGSFQGKCNCGSKIKSTFQVAGDEVTFTCVATPGSGKCKKTYLRNEHRKKAAEKMKSLTTDQYQSEIAVEKNMLQHDPQPPHLSKASVLRTAKAELIRSEYHHSDPIVSLSIMKEHVWPGTIHDLSFSPFYVHYWTHHQRDVYIKYAAQGNSCIFIDATGGISPKFTKLDKTTTSSLFLYLIAINVSGQQFTIGQMISERQDTNAIINFWNDWLKYGFPQPKEVVMDSNKAQLIATITVFTPYKTIG